MLLLGNVFLFLGIHFKPMIDDELVHQSVRGAHPSPSFEAMISISVCVKPRGNANGCFLHSCRTELAYMAMWGVID